MNTPKETKVVEAVGVASKSMTLGGKRLSQEIEAAMSQAVLDSMHAGITDPAEIKAAMMAARQRIRDRKEVEDAEAEEAQ